VAIAAIGAAASCGSSGAGALAVSGEAISCAASTYISDGQCVDLPPFSDASVDFDNDQDATGDAGVSTDAAPDAATQATMQMTAADARHSGCRLRLEPSAGSPRSAGVARWVRATDRVSPRQYRADYGCRSG